MRVIDKRIPTLLAVIFLIIGVAVTSILVQQRVIIFQHAAPTENPQNLRITNISDTGFTVTYTTDIDVTGTISLDSKTDKSQVILDERDQQSGVPNQYMVHSISAKNLSAGTTYTFTILSGTTKYLDGAQPFSVTTPSQLSQDPSEQIPLAGKIILSNGTKPKEAIIFVTTDNGQLLSTLLNTAGLYIIPLNTMRTKDLSSYIKFTSATKLQILAINQSLTSRVTTRITGINPVPPITLSQNYDFTLQNSPIASSSATASFPVLSFTDTTLQATPEIITPKNNESFTDQQPQFKGTATPNSTVTISIHSTSAVTTQVTADANGNWDYRPTTPLPPGQHTITITTPDKYGILHTLTQAFTVFAAGSQVNQTATPSATLAPTKAPTPTPTKKPTPTSSAGSGSPTPTISKSPTPTISRSATPTPALSGSVTRVVTNVPTPRVTLPPTGSNTVAVAGLAGIATTVIGIVLFLITHGAAL